MWQLCTMHKYQYHHRDTLTFLEQPHFFDHSFAKAKTTPRHKTQKPWLGCFAPLKQAVHFAVLCEDPALILSRPFVKAVVVGWHRGGWQCLSQSAHIGGMSPANNTNKNKQKAYFAVFPNMFSCCIKLYWSSVHLLVL